MKKLIRSCFKPTYNRYFYGNLKDSDRIFTNVYGDGDFGIKGAMKRVIALSRETGTKPKTYSLWVPIGSSTKLKSPGCAAVAAPVFPLD